MRWGPLTWDVPGLSLSFNPSSRLHVNGQFNLTGGTLAASIPTLGWGGVTINSGGQLSTSGLVTLNGGEIYRPTTSSGLTLNSGSTLALGGGADLRSTSSLTIPSGAILDAGPGSELRFSVGSSLTVMGSLTANAAIFTASNPAQGWIGIKFSPGSTGSLTGTTIERVSGWGNIAVDVNNASVNLDGTEIRSAVAPSAVTGLRVSGAQAAASVYDTQIAGMTNGGIVANSYAKINVTNSSVTDNAGPGVVAGYHTEVFLYPALYVPGPRTRGVQITDNTGDGAVATASSSLVFGKGYYPSYGYHADGYSSMTNNGGRGVAASTSATMYAGNSGAMRYNRLYDNTGLDAEAAGTGSHTYVRCNWWNDVTPPFRTSVSGGATLDNSYWLLEDPYLNPQPACVNAPPVGARAAGGEMPEPLAASRSLADRLDAALTGSPASAFDTLRRIVAEVPSAPEAASALTEVAGLSKREDVPPGAIDLLQTMAATGPRRLQSVARRGLIGVRERAGDRSGALSLVDALVADGYRSGSAGTDDVLWGQNARVYLLTDAGRREEAVQALSAVEALAPGSTEAWLARLHLGLPVNGPNAATTPHAVALARRADAEDISTTSDFQVGDITPNPSVDRATLALRLAETSSVRMSVFDALGREVAVLLDTTLPAGEHRAEIETSSLTPGTYLVRVVTEGAAVTRRLTIVR